MSDKIKTSQLFYILTGYVLGSALLLSLVDNIIKQDAWVTIVVGFAVSVPFILSFVFLIKRFPGKNLIEINILVFGNILGNIVSVLYFIFFFLLLALNLNYLADFYGGYVLPETPKIILIVTIALVCAFAVKRGVAAIGKASFIVTMIAITIAAVTTLLLIGEMDFTNFLPLLNQPAKLYIQVSHVIVAVPFLDIIALLMVTSQLGSHVHLTRSMLGSVAAAGAVLLFIVLRNTVVLGAAAGVVGNSSYEAVRLINIGEFLTRIELLITIGYTCCMFIKISFLYYATLSSFSHILKVKSIETFILPMGSVAVIVAAALFKSSAADTEWGSRYHMILATPFTMIFPPLTLLVAKIRKAGNLPVSAPNQLHQ